MERFSKPIAAVLCVLFFVLAFTSMAQKSVTADEFAHLPAGLSYIKTGSYSLYSHNPPLVKVLTARAIDGEAVMPETRAAERYLEVNDHWGFAREFMVANTASYDDIFTHARVVIIFIALIGAVVLYRWARLLYGPGPALLALSFYVLSPNILAHSRLVTTDVGGAVAALAALFLFARWCEKGTWRLVVGTGLVLGLAELTKFTALFLYPVFIIFFIVFFVKSGTLRKNLPGLIVIFIISVVVINAGYHFGGSFSSLGSYEFVSKMMISLQGILPGGLPIPLPHDYVAGFDLQKEHAEGGFFQYFMGVKSTDGWWLYYPVAFLLKVPLALLAALLLLALLVAARKVRDLKPDELLVLIYIAFYVFVFTLFTSINVGLRYMLAILPLLFLLCARIVASEIGGGIKKALAAVLVICFGAATFSAHPNYLSFFNSIGGGYERGHNYLIDSNIDWGQDLKLLKRYMRDNSIDTIKLAYFGGVDPDLYGLEFTPLRKGESGTAAVSVNLYHGMPYPMIIKGQLYISEMGYYEFLKDYPVKDMVGGSIMIFDLP